MISDKLHEGDPAYRNMAGNFDDSIEFQAALELMLKGR